MKRNFLGIIVFIFFLSGCATIERHAVPLGMLDDVRILGRQDIRTVGGAPNLNLEEDLLSTIEQEEEDLYWTDPSGCRVYSALTISGGGANGAYGAGLLKGWSEAGTRPKFKIITGISTGAIIAPLVFLGNNYDPLLEKFYTTYATKDLIKPKGFFQMIFGNSVASNKPFETLINQYFSKEIIDQIAQEHQKGRRLYIGTTNLDAQKLIIWDMGRIASIGTEPAIALFRKIILASASIPTAFPPVYFNAELDGEEYNEMHVDGGLIKQVFFLYGILKDFDKGLREKGIDLSKVKLRIFVIRNGYADPLWEEVPDKVAAITARSLDTIINSQSMGDLYRLYMFTLESQGEFNLAYIPENYEPDPKEFFDPKEMQRLFNFGYEEAQKGYPWRNAPPGF